MFLRKITMNYRSGPVDYLYLLQGYRDGGRVRQRVVANLGRADVLAPQLNSLIRMLRPYLKEEVGPLGEVRALQALAYGGPAVARKLWEQLGLREILSRQVGEEAGERVFVLVAHRLLCPGSEHALAWWLEDSYVADNRGQRVRARWQSSGRVRVAHRQLQQWYRSLDRLVEAKEAIEDELYLRLRDIFGLRVDLVFMDLTSAYFEGESPEGLARHGHPRDGRRRNRQVLVGVVMASGWPIASYVFEGNRLDHSTAEEIVTQVRSRYELQRVVWVADRGMVSDEVLSVLTRAGDRYLVGVKRRRNPAAQAALSAAANGPWMPLGEGGAVAEVQLSGEPARYLVVRSAERLGFERDMRRRSMRRCRDRLTKLQQLVATGRVSERAAIGARVGAILKEHHGHRYFDREVTADGSFQFRVDRNRLRAEQRLEGTYILKTNDPSLDAVAAVAAYKELQTVERGFRALKNVLAVRPIYHQTERRVRAHLFIAHLALVVGCALEKALKQAGLSMALDTALAALKPVRLVTLELADARVCVVTKPTPHAKAVLKAVGLHQLSAPAPVL
jgi:hypothetical protein